MKNLLFLALFALFLQAESTNNQPASAEGTFKNDVLSSNDYIVAKTLFKVGNYSESYILFSELFPKHPENEMVNFYLGMSASKTENYNIAVSAFERVLINNSTFHRARLEMALALYKLGLKDEAKKEFKIVASQPIPQEVRDNINRYLKAIEKDNEVLFTTFILGLNYDDNITNGIDGGTFNYYNQSKLTTTQNAKEEADTSHSEIIDMKYIQRFSDETNLVHGLLALNKGQSDEKDYNLKLLSYRPTLIFTNKDSRKLISFAFDKITTGDANNFKSALLAYSKEVGTRKVFGYGYGIKAQKVFYDLASNENKDYKKYAANLFIKYSIFTYSLDYAQDSKEQGTNVDIDKNIISHALAYNDQIFGESISLKYIYKSVNYDDVNKLFTTKREDTFTKIQGNISHKIDKKSLFSMGLAHQKNESNQNSFDYEKNTISINYIRSFAW